MDSAPLDLASERGELGVRGWKALTLRAVRESTPGVAASRASEPISKQDCMKSFEMVFVFLTTSGGDTRRADCRCGETRLLPRVLTGRSPRT